MFNNALERPISPDTISTNKPAKNATLPSETPYQRRKKGLPIKQANEISTNKQLTLIQVPGASR
ncbi:hypothetical protein LRS40_19350 [Leclercia sp. G3L]|uniref:hypothetical protein n=1 Tax=Leclercia sp. G3L TaxID=2898725 RepID=UPI001E3731F1|nr:hypothetical protein [Leclercia sp. G3L]UGB01797.1 hypothetical protein LRS40_19350 [Leclercia sp. G3L]